MTVTDSLFSSPIDASLHRDSVMVHGGCKRTPFMETSEALFLTSGYVYDSAEEAAHAFKNDGARYIYSRYANPTVTAFQERLRWLEGAEACWAVGSGMAAVFTALLARAGAGSRVVAARALFGSCYHILSEILPRLGVETVFVDGGDLTQWETALAPGADAVFLESPCNPTLEVLDIAAIARLARTAGAMTIVDNVFGIPGNQRPLALGADVVVYSATKHIDGQGRCLGGAILGPADWCREKIMPLIRHTGPSLSPFNAWLLLKGLETLPIRAERMCGTAASLAQWLADAPAARAVHYPHGPDADLARAQMPLGGSIVTVGLKGGRAGAFRFLNALTLIRISNNLGDAKSLATHPATTTHQRLTPEERAAMGITEGMVRLSIGLEHPDDLRADLAQALAAV